MISATRRHSWGAAALLLFACSAAIAAGAPPSTRGGEGPVASPLAVFSDQVGPQDALQAVARHRDRILVVGSKGLVLESVDGARSWRRHPIPSRPPLIDVTVCPDGRFYLLDFRRGLWVADLETARWKRMSIAVAGHETAPRSLALRCAPNGQLWAVGEESSILRSDDGGRRWQATLPDGSDRLLTTVGFVSAERVRVTGEFGSYFESDDAGASWRQGPDLPGELYPHAAYVAADATLWAVGNTGHIYRLDAGAPRWSEESSGTTRALYGLARVGERLIAVGAGGVTLARGKNWQRLPLRRPEQAARDWRGVVAVGEGSFIAVGEAGAMRVGRVPELADTDGSIGALR